MLINNASAKFMLDCQSVCILNVGRQWILLQTHGNRWFRRRPLVSPWGRV